MSNQYPAKFKQADLLRRLPAAPRTAQASLPAAPRTAQASLPAAPRTAQASEIQLIHVARQKLGMDDDTYRALLHDRFGVASSKDMDWKQRRELLDYFKTLGFKVVSSRAGTAGRPAPAKDKVAQVRKIRALLIALDNKPDAYADGMSRQMFKIDRFEWCTGAQLGKIIAALEYAKQRKSPPTPLPVPARQTGLPVPARQTGLLQRGGRSEGEL